MKYAEYFRKLARRCRILSRTAADPEFVDQMRLWAVDFAVEADEAERRAVKRERVSQRLPWRRNQAFDRKSGDRSARGMSRTLQDQRVTTQSKPAKRPPRSRATARVTKVASR
jgi:hypothetical protein